MHGGLNRNLNRRGFLKAAGTVGVGLWLAGCVAPAAQEATEGSVPSAEQVEIVLWGWWDVRMNLYAQAGAAFTEANPDVTLKVETLPGDELQQKVYSSVAAGTGPNLLKMGEFFFPMRKEGLLLPYPDDVFPDSWFKEMYPSVNWDAYGRYVVPSAASGTILVYNKKMFEEAGLDPDSPPTTWDEFIEAAKAVTQSDDAGITRSGFVPADEYPGMNQIYQQGGNLVRIDGDQKIATLDSPEAERAFTHLAELASVHNVWDPTFPSNIESVGTGLAAMTEDQAWIIGEFSATYADINPDLAYTHNPTPTGEPSPYYGYKSTVLSLSALTGHPDQEPATFRFLEYLLKTAGKDFYLQKAELLSSAPVRADLADDERLQQNVALAKVAEVVPFEYDPVQPPPEMYTMWSDALKRIVLEGEPVAVSLATLNQQVQGLIDQGLADNLV